MTGVRPATIRVINYCGDYDDLNEINVIGPYPDTAARNADLRRLDALPGVYGSLEFEPSTIDPAAADFSATPEHVADAAGVDDILAALQPGGGAR